MSIVGVSLLFGCALGFNLPAPENLSIRSVNFNHTLSWNPGPGSPPGTSYMIYNLNRHHRKLITKSNKTSVKLKLQHQREVYYLTVVATYNNSCSPDSPKLHFSPYEITEIGPPTVTVTGCGRCLHVNITLPPADGGVDIHNFYRPNYRVNLRKRGEQLHGEPHMTKKRNLVLQNLHGGTEYCVQVWVETINTHMQPSAWTCAFTSRAEPSTSGVMVGLVFLLVFVAVAVMVVMVFLLYHLGFICKLKVMLPTVLRTGLSAGHSLTPERTIPDLISISPKVEKRKHNSAAAPQPAESAGQEEEEEEEQEEEGAGRSTYVVRNTEFFSGEGSCSDSADRLCEAGLPAGEQCDEVEDEGEEVGRTEDQKDQEEEEEEEDFNCSGDINLLSVMVRALVECEEEGQALEWTGQEALLSHDQTSKSARTPVEDQTVSDEEEEEEFSAYLRHL